MIAAPGALSNAHETAHDEPESSLSPGLAYIDAKRRAAQNEEDIDRLATGKPAKPPMKGEPVPKPEAAK